MKLRILFSQALLKVMVCCFMQQILIKSVVSKVIYQIKTSYVCKVLVVLCCFTGVIKAQPVQLYEGLPMFHGAKIIGNRPGTELVYTVAATGTRPITFHADKLPEGLQLDTLTGIIRGVVKDTGAYRVPVVAKNVLGETTQNLQIVIGENLCLTPPMGWNSWNVFTKDVDQQLLIEIANAMVSSGMRDLGYQYINIDDFWHDSIRSPDGKPRCNPEKFPSGIKYVANYLHSQGLKLGIYSDAGNKTCGKCFGSYGYEEIDAATYAEWGVDLLKYDFCYVPWKKKEAITRYKKMGDALKKTNRSIVYSVCNWGLFKPWEWVDSLGGNYWRTTPDIFDTWRGGIPFMMSTLRILKKQNKILAYPKQGHWNDPDMLIVGNYGKGKATGRNGLFKGMTDEQYKSHMSLWAMMSAPLLASCDLRSMNDVTKSILMNPGLLAVNQDEAGNNTELVAKRNGFWFYRKKLSDGSEAIAVFNVRKSKRKLPAEKWRSTVLSGDKIYTDIWSGVKVGDELLEFKPCETKVLRSNMQ